jgi:hypothetical protein
LVFTKVSNIIILFKVRFIQGSVYSGFTLDRLQGINVRKKNTKKNTKKEQHQEIQ